jgi:hypothetical protein
MRTPHPGVLCDTDRRAHYRRHWGPSERNYAEGQAILYLFPTKGPTKRSTGSGSGHALELPRVQPSDDREGPSERSADRGRGSAGFTKSSTSHEPSPRRATTGRGSTERRSRLRVRFLIHAQLRRFYEQPRVRANAKEGETSRRRGSDVAG